MALEPCHAFFQFNTQPMSIWERGEWVKKNNMTEMFDDDEDDIDEMDRLNVPKYKLSLQLYQRSADIFLGVPFNIASYSLLLQMVSQCVNMIPNEFVWSGGDCHLYDNHEEQSGEMLSRKPKELPSVLLNPNVKDIFGFTFDDIELVNYNPHPLIRGKVAV
jgi:thymidylate synthase